MSRGLTRRIVDRGWPGRPGVAPAEGAAPWWCGRLGVVRARNGVFLGQLAAAAPCRLRETGHPPLRRRPYQGVRRGCPIHVVWTQWPFSRTFPVGASRGREIRHQPRQHHLSRISRQLVAAAPAPDTRNGHQSPRNRPYQTIRRGCHIQVVSTAWLGHPRLMQPGRPGGGLVSSVTTVRRECSSTRRQRRAAERPPMINLS